jgi:type I restriction enzyme S subunit
MSEQWPLKPLSEIATVLGGSSAPQGEHLFEEGTYPFIRTADVGKIRFGEIFETKDYLNDRGIEKLRLFKKGTILLPKSGASTFLNHRVIMGMDAYVASHLAGITADEKLMDSRFLLYGLSQIKAQDLLQDIAYPSLKLSLIKKIKVPVPPLEQQQRIVSILDETFKEINGSIESTESSLIASAEVFPSKLHQIYNKGGLDWSDFTLAEVSLDFGRGKSKHRPRNYKPLYGGPYPFVQTGDVRSSNHYISEYTQTYSEMGLAQSKLWPKGTVCITIAANIAETAILDFDACFPDSVIGVVVNPEITTNEYVEYALQFLKNKLQKEGKGSAQDNINMRTFKELKFPFAPVNEQKEIVDLLNLLNEQMVLSMKSQQNKIQHLKELKQSLLQEAFNGTL